MKLYFRNKRQIVSMVILFAVLTITACTGGNTREDLDSPTSGEIHISVDESFKPVIDSQIQVFEALNPNAKIVAHYKTEAACFEDLKKDSTRMIIVTRGLNREEEAYYKQKVHFIPSTSKVANDGLAIIVNNDSPDTLLTLSKIRGILSGTTGDTQNAVFDGLEGSSGFRFAKDSILKDVPIDMNRAYGENNPEDVINYVEKHKNVLGFVGVSWIGNPEDTTQLSFLTKVKIAAIQCNCPEKSYVKPYQANIMTRRYPMVRGLYYILKENYSGLASGFANFLESERGQLIFQRAYLGPGKMNFTIRAATTH